MIPEPLLRELREGFSGKIQEKVSLRTWTTFRCSGAASVVISPSGVEELSSLVRLLNDHQQMLGEGYRVIGRGSNLLVRDGGYPGLLIDLTKGFGEIKLLEKGEEGARVHAGAGVLNGALLNWAKEEKFASFGWAYGIPGTVGGGVWMNAGTPQGSYGEITIEVHGVDASGEPKSLNVDSSDFRYREFPDGKEMVITGATLLLQAKSVEEVEREIEQAKEKRKGQPIDLPNFGSVFKNPSGDFAGRLIEAAGLKGLRIGDAEISNQHANFIVNLGTARTSDVLSLMGRAQKEVENRFDVSLSPEVLLIGVDG